MKNSEFREGIRAVQGAEAWVAELVNKRGGYKLPGENIAMAYSGSSWQQ